MSLHTKLKTNKFINYKTIFSILISILGIWLGFKNFNFQEFAQALMDTNLFYLTLATLVIIFSVYLRAIRWKYLVLPLKEVKIYSLFEAEMIGYFGNNVFPLKMGEILRAYSLGKKEKIPVAAAFGTIVNERLLDVLVFIIIMGVGVFFFPDLPEWVRKTGIIGIAILIISIVSIIILNFKRHFIKKYWQKILDKYQERKFFHNIISLVEGLLTLVKTPHFLWILLQSIVIWIVTISEFWFLGMCLNISFSLYDILLIFVVTSAVFAIPAAPGYIGTYHAGAIRILIFLGINTAKAQAMAVIMHAVGFIALTAIGLVYFLKYHITLEETKQISLREDKNREHGQS